MARVKDTVLTGTRRTRAGDLDTAVHTLHRAADGKTVVLVGTVHMAEANYYRVLRSAIDDLAKNGAEVHYEKSRDVNEGDCQTSAEMRAIKVLGESVDAAYGEAIKGFGLPWVAHLDGPLAPSPSWRNSDSTKLDTIRLAGPDYRGEFDRILKVIQILMRRYTDDTKPARARARALRQFVQLHVITSNRVAPNKAALGMVNAVRWLLRKPPMGWSAGEWAAFFTFRECNAALAALEASNDVVMLWHGSHLPGIGAILLRNGFQVKSTWWHTAVHLPRKGQKP